MGFGLAQRLWSLRDEQACKGSNQGVPFSGRSMEAMEEEAEGYPLVRFHVGHEPYSQLCPASVGSSLFLPASSQS